MKRVTDPFHEIACHYLYLINMIYTKVIIQYFFHVKYDTFPIRFLMQSIAFATKQIVVTVRKVMIPTKSKPLVIHSVK